jgi:hypothetical protein
MRTLSIILFGLLTINVYSQTEKILIKFCPLALVDINIPTVQAGLELKISKKITWYNEFGIRYRKGLIESYADTSFIASSGYKIKSEIRYYFKNKQAFTFNGPYFAANIFFIKDRHNREIPYLRNNVPPVMTDDFGVKKSVSGFNLVFGYQKRLPIPKKFFIEFYGGFGIRLTNNNTIGEQYNKSTDTILDAQGPKISQFGESGDANKGFSISPNFTLGFRISFKL